MRTPGHWQTKLWHALRKLLSSVATSPVVWHLLNFKMVAGDVHGCARTITAKVDMKLDHTQGTSLCTVTFLHILLERLIKWRTGRLTLVYFMHSSQFVLTRGIIPNLWAINSSGKTVVFDSNSTMSMAERWR